MYIAEDSHLRNAALFGPFQKHSERKSTYSTQRIYVYTNVFTITDSTTDRNCITVIQNTSYITCEKKSTEALAVAGYNKNQKIHKITTFSNVCNTGKQNSYVPQKIKRSRHSTRTILYGLINYSKIQLRLHFCYSS